MNLNFKDNFHYLKLAKKNQILRHPLFKKPNKIFNLLKNSFGILNPNISMLQLEITSLCNLSCEYCTQHAGKAQGELNLKNIPSGNMQFDTFKQILSKYNEALYLQIQGQGEPLLHPEFTKFVNHAKQNGFYVLSITNGMLLNEARCNELLENGIDNLAISLDISSPEEIEKTRKGVKYKKVVQNLIKLIELRNRNNYSTLVGISAVLQKKNLNELELRIKELSSLGIDYLIISPLASLNATNKDYLKLYSEHLLEELIISEIKISDKHYQDTYITTCSYLNYGEKKKCIQTNSIYFRYDGSTAYCANRHKVDCLYPEKEMKEAANLMLKNITPNGCHGCHYIPARMR